MFSPYPTLPASLPRLRRRLLRTAARMKPLALMAAVALGAAPAAHAEFTISLIWGAGMDDKYKSYFTEAANAWQSQIFTYKDGVTLTGITITAKVAPIDGVGNVLGQAGPTQFTLQQGTTYATRGVMEFDSADVQGMINKGNFGKVIEHEMGHVLGLGTLWYDNGLINLAETEYTGARGLEAWRDEFRQTSATFVPVEQGGGAGTAGGHWDEVDYGAGNTGIVSKYTGRDMADELMTGWAGNNMFTSTLTLGSLMDLGYVIGLPRDANGDYLVTKGPYYGKMTGAYRLLKTTADRARVYGDNDITGGVILSGGTLEVRHIHALGRGTVLVQNGATLDTGDFALTGITTLTLEEGTLTGTSGSITATQFNLMSGEVRASLAGTASVVKTGTGQVTLFAANTHSGGTTVESGLLVVAHRDALAAGNVLVTGGTLRTDTAITVSRLTVDGGTVTASATGAITDSVVELRTGSVSAMLTGTGSVVKNGAGTATLSGANTHTGGTMVNEGVLSVASATALGRGPLDVTGGKVDVGAVAVTGLSTVTLTRGEITGAGGSFAAERVDLYSGTVSTGIAGSAVVTKWGYDSVRLAGDNRFTGGLTVYGGTVVAESANALGAGLVTTRGAGAVTITHADAAASATVDLSGGSITFDASLTAGSIGTLMGDTGLNLVNTAGTAFALTLGKNNATTTYAGAFSGAGSITKDGTGALTLTAGSTHTGGTTVAGGTLVMGHADALGAGPIRVTGGTLEIGDRDLVSAKPFTLGGGTVHASAEGSITAPVFNVLGGTVEANLTGAGTLVKSGKGTATLSVQSTYTGGTTVNEGDLTVAYHRALGTGELTVAGGTLTAQASITGLSKLTLASGKIAGFGSVKADAYDLRQGEVTGKLAGAATLEKNSDGSASGGIVKLFVANPLTGAVQVNAGTLAIGNANALGKGVTVVRDGATLQVGVVAGAVADDATQTFGDTTAFAANWSGQEVKLDRGTLDFRLTSATAVSRLISGTGGVTLNGTGTITLQNATYSGETVVNSGKLVLASGTMLTGPIRANAGGAVEFIPAGGGVYDLPANLAGPGALRISAGHARLGGLLAHTGEIAVAAGAELTLGASGAPVALHNALLRVEQGGRLSGSAGVAGALENAGTLAPGFSPGTITLAGDFTNAATGTLVMEVAADGTHDQIRYAGTARLDGTLQLAYLGSPVKGTTVDLLVDTNTADGLPSISGRFARVLTPDGSGVAFATTTGVNFIVGGSIFDIPGASTPAAGRLGSFATALVRAGAIPNFVNTATTSGAALAATVTSAAPLGLASATALPLTQTLGDNDRLYRHLTARRFERGAGETSLDYSPYAYVNSVRATADSAKDGQAFDHNGAGGSVGADVEPARDLTMGAKVGYDAGDATFHRNGGKLTQNRLHVTVYGSQLIDHRYFVDTGAFGGYSLYDVKQRTALGQNTGDTGGWDAGVFVTGGFVAPLSAKTSLTPHAGLTLSRAQVDAFNETGNALALHVDGYAQTSLASRLGVGLNRVATVGDLRMTFSLDASWVHEWLDNEVDIDGAVAGSGFSTSAVATVKDHLELGPEINIGVSENGSVSLAYKYDYALGDATAHRFDIGYRTRF